MADKIGTLIAPKIRAIIAESAYTRRPVCERPRAAIEREFESEDRKGTDRHADRRSRHTRSDPQNRRHRRRPPWTVDQPRLPGPGAAQHPGRSVLADRRVGRVSAGERRRGVVFVARFAFSLA